MVFINEWFPNPHGNDAKGEFVELYNSGNTSISLNGYFLTPDNKKKFSLTGRSIAPRGYLVLSKAQTKLTLKNMDGGLLLYGPNGAIIDRAQFMGSAPDAKSYSRVDYGMGDTGHFTFVDPTPGSLNKTINTAVAVRHYPTGVPLNHSLGPFEFLGLVIGTSVMLAGLLIYAIKKDKNLSELFFS
jgi:hypothetical protein